MKSSVIAGGLQPSSFAEPQPSSKECVDDPGEAEDFLFSIPPHPLGLKPLGNQYTASSNARDSMGLFQLLPDEALVIFLEYLDAYSLRMLGSTCKALFAFSHSEDIWKTLFIEWLVESHESLSIGPVLRIFAKSLRALSFFSTQLV